MSDNRQPRKLNTRAAQGSERKVYRAPAPEQSRHRPEPGRSAYSAQESAGTAHRRKAKKKKKTIIIVYNSTRKEANWLPSYMSGYEDDAKPFWKYDANGKKVGDYSYIKEVLGF